MRKRNGNPVVMRARKATGPNGGRPGYRTEGLYLTMRTSSKLLVAAAAAGLVATGGSAFTASNTVGGENVAGYGTAAVTGAITEVIEHTLSADGKTITSTSLTFTTDLNEQHAVKAGFGATDLESCTVTLATAPAKDTAVCTYATGYTTANATTFNVAVN